MGDAVIISSMVGNDGTIRRSYLVRNVCLVSNDAAKDSRHKMDAFLQIKQNKFTFLKKIHYYNVEHNLETQKREKGYT